MLERLKERFRVDQPLQSTQITFPTTKLSVRKIALSEYPVIANTANLWTLNAYGYLFSEARSKKWPLFMASQVSLGISAALKEERTSNPDVLVCETLDGKIQGICVSSLQATCPEKAPFSPSERCYQLNWLVANPYNLKCQKQEPNCISGAGKALLEAVELRAQTLGCGGVVLTAGTGAEEFYRKYGYQSNGSTFYKKHLGECTEKR